MGQHCITGLWVVLSIMLTAAIIFSMFSPVWFQNFDNHPRHTNISHRDIRQSDAISFGILRYCRDAHTYELMFQCPFYSGLTSMPSLAWRVCTIIYAVGAGLMIIGVLLTSFGMCMRDEQAKRLRILIAYIQIFAGKNALAFVSR